MDLLLKKLIQCSSFKDAEYIKIAEEAWEEAVEIAKSSEGWKEEKNDKKTVRFIE